MRLPALLLAAALLCAGNARADDTAPAVAFDTGFATPLQVDAALLATFPPATVEADDHGTRGTWTGVKLLALLERAGAPVGEQLRGANLSKYVLVTAADGYRVTFSLGELDGTFGKSGAILAWQRDGADLPAKEAPFRVIVPGDGRPGRWIRQVVRVELFDAPGASAPPHAH